MTETNDDELLVFEARGLDLPPGGQVRYFEHDGARLWSAIFGAGPPVVLLHGGLGHSGNWGKLVAPLVLAGYQVITLDTRGHGRSTRDERPFRYDQLARDVEAVLDQLAIKKASLVGWSDGACTALVLASQSPERVKSVFYFACNMDASGTKPFDMVPPLLDRCFSRHRADYRRLSAAPEQFETFVEDVGHMQRTQPNFTAQDLQAIRVPVTVAHAEFDEFILQGHSEYLAKTIPDARWVFLPGVSHFAPLQRPGSFHQAVLEFLA